MSNFLSKLKGQTALTAAALCVVAGTAMADQVFQDDVIVVGSLCVGQDCVNGESFGFDTIRLKENNLRIKFQDTSTSASFPTTDWSLVANDTGNGGANYFAIQDDNASRIPFRVEGNAPANTLVAASDGHVGIQTLNPVVNLHVTDGNSPTLRLEQDGSSGFTPQTYDIAANEANFFIRDVTNGSSLVFRVKPGAPEDSIHIAADGDIGLGTNIPQGTLDIRSGTENTDIRLEQTNGANAEAWTIRNNAATGRLVIVHGTATPFKFGPDAVENLLRVGITNNNEVDINGNLVVTGTVTSGGPTCASGCDAVFDPSYDLPTISEHAERMTTLGYLPNVGPTLPHEPFVIAEKLGNMLNELEHAHLFIAELNQRIEKLETELAAK